MSGQKTVWPYVIGVTGNIACGKSTVLRMLQALGAVAVDADQVYHQLIVAGSPLWRQLVDHFGESVLTSAGEIDRHALGTIVFSNPAALSKLDQITHPAVIFEIEKMLAGTSARVAAIDAVKLVESGMDKLCDSVWVVTCNSDDQMERLVARDGMTTEEANRRIGSQPPNVGKIAAADVVIDNSCSVEATAAQVQRAWDSLAITE